MKNGEFKHFVGIDISKHTLDLALINHPGTEVFSSIQVSNDASGMKQIAQWIRKTKLKFTDILFCLEHTGVYGLPVQFYLLSKKAFLWLEMPVQIIKSIGLQRGKNDQVDARRIAQYACRHQEDSIQWVPPTEEQTAIKDLLKLRDRLIEIKNKLLAPVNELNDMHEFTRSKRIEQYSSKPVKSVETQIKRIEQELEELIKKDPAIKKNIDLMTSIPGIGKMTALAFILVTDNFTKKFNARQLACHSGCAPFEHKSGTSVKGKTRVSHMANKNLKTLLTMCATSLTNCHNELSEYYHRKVAEGKNKMSVINAMRNKLIHRIVAVIERQTPYVKNPNESFS